jgi:hypothetical protein
MPSSRDDQQAIPDSVRLFRRISPACIVFDRNKNQWRPTSQNFQDSKDGTPMSVFAENIANSHGEVPSDFLRGRWSAWHLAALPAGWMRECGQSVYPEKANQDPDDTFQSHTAVEGPKPTNQRGKLGERFEWVVAPTKPPPP